MFFQANVATPSKSSSLTLPLVNRRQLATESMEDWNMERRNSIDDQTSSIAKTSSPNNLFAPEAQKIRPPHRKAPAPWPRASVLPRATSPCPLACSEHLGKRGDARSSDSSTCSPSDESSVDALNDSASSSRPSCSSQSKSVPKCAVRQSTMAREPPNHGRQLVLYRGLHSRGSNDKVEEDLAIIWESQCSVMDRLAERARNLSISAHEGGCTPHRDRSPGIRRASYWRVKPISSSPIPKTTWDTPFPKNADMHSPIRDSYRSRRNRSRSRSPRNRWNGQRKNAEDKYRNIFVNQGRTYSGHLDVSNSATEPMLMIMDRQYESMSYHSSSMFGTPSLSSTTQMDTTITSDVSITLQQCEGPSAVWRLM